MIDVAQAGLPTGYALKRDHLGTLLYVYKNGVPLRQKPKTVSHALPIWFRLKDRAKAVEYAVKHAELGLEAHQQVPGFEY